jgi:predicted nucleic acid-binding protein
MAPKKIPTAAEQVEIDALRLRARQDLFWLAKSVLGFKEMTEAVHRPMANLFLVKDPTIPLYDLDEIKRRMLLAPRGSFKTCMDQADIVQLILCYPDIRILIITGTNDLATKMVAELKQFFQSPVMQKLFPEYAPDPKTRWGDCSTIGRTW